MPRTDVGQRSRKGLLGSRHSFDSPKNVMIQDGGWNRGMAYEIRYSNEVVEQLKKLRVFDRTAILDQIGQVLIADPTAVSKSRVKRLREPAPTQYRLRVGEFRVFYDVAEEAVLIIQVLSKQDSIDFRSSSRRS